MKTVRMKSIEEIKLLKSKHLKRSLQNFRKMMIKEMLFGRKKMMHMMQRLKNKGSKTTKMTATGSRDLQSSRLSKMTLKQPSSKKKSATLC